MSYIDISTVKQHFENFKNAVIAASQGVLNDFRTQSNLTMLGEAFSLGLAEVEATTEAAFSDRIDRSILALFGLTETEGAKASVVLKFTPTTINLVSSFSIDAAFRVTINGTLFQTEQVVTVPPGNLSAQVIATAVDAGEVNVSVNSQVTWNFVNGLSNVAVVEVVSSGTNDESVSKLSASIFEVLRNRALITQDNYIYTVKQILGASTYIKVIPNIGKDGSTYQRGTMHIFALNSDYQGLTSVQKNSLAVELSKGWASVFISDLQLYPLKVSVIGKISLAADNATVSTAIAAVVSQYFSEVFSRDPVIDLNDVIIRVGAIADITRIDSITFDTGSGIGTALDLPLPSARHIPRLTQLTTVLNGVSNVL
jgi:hypothetical protein